MKLVGIDAANNSMDVRAKQRLSFRVVWFLSACVYSVSPHVISAVRHFVFKNTKHGLFENQENTLRVSSKVALSETAC